MGDLPYCTLIRVILHITAATQSASQYYGDVQLLERTGDESAIEAGLVDIVHHSGAIGK